MDVFYENLLREDYLFFGLLVLLPVFAIIKSTLDSTSLPGKVKYFWIRYERTFVLLSVSVSIVSVCTLSLFHWFPNKEKYEQIENYVFITTVTLIISLIFSVFEWALSVLDRDSFIINNQYAEILRSKSKAGATQTRLLFIEIIRKLDQYDILFGDGIFITELSRRPFHPIVTKSLEAIGINDGYHAVINTSNDQLFFVIRTIATGHYRTVSFEHQFIVIYCGQAHALLLETNWPLSKFSKLEMADQLGIVRDLFNKERQYCEDAIAHEDKIIEGDVVFPFFDFVFNNMFEMFSIRQGYFVPNSIIAKLVHLIFGIYKFLFFGALISLLIK